MTWRFALYLSVHEKCGACLIPGMKEDRQKFKNVKHEADCMIKTSHNSYLDKLVGIIDDSYPIKNSRPNT